MSGSADDWKQYNEHFGEFERTMITNLEKKNGQIPIFAGLFAAVTATFIIESIKMLQPDAQEDARNILIFITEQISNQTEQVPVFPYTPSRFSPETYAVTVNICLFTSLGLSLCAAIISIFYYQWIGDHQLISGRSAEEKALHYQIRFESTKQWKLGMVIDMPMLFIATSATLFFAGIMTWLMNLNRGIFFAFLISGLQAPWVYIVTTIIAMLYTSTPFRNGAAKILFRVIHGTTLDQHQTNVAANDQELRSRALERLAQARARGEVGANVVQWHYDQTLWGSI